MWLIGSMFKSLCDENKEYFVLFLVFCCCLFPIALLLTLDFAGDIFSKVPFGFCLFFGVPVFSMNLVCLVGYKKLGEIFEREKTKREGKNEK